MMRQYKNVIVEKDPDKEKYTILAPAVGVYYKNPEKGAYLKTNSGAGILKQLNSLFHLRIPRDVSGFVQAVFTENHANPVQYKQKLFTLVPTGLETIDKEEGPEKGEAVSALELKEGRISIISPTDGIFYRRPNPESPPYVSEGQVIEKGTVMGLVEVMKSFNQIKFFGPDFPERARVVKILGDDASEIHSGQTLYILEKTD